MAGFHFMCLALELYIFVVKMLHDYTAVQILTWRHQSMLAGIAESVMCPAASHMASIYFHCLVSHLISGSKVTRTEN
jgi:hypothetical protein